MKNTSKMWKKEEVSSNGNIENVKHTEEQQKRWTNEKLAQGKKAKSDNGKMQKGDKLNKNVTTENQRNMNNAKTEKTKRENAKRRYIKYIYIYGTREEATTAYVNM